MTLLVPKYDAAAQTVTYTVRVIPDDEPKNESIVAWYPPLPSHTCKLSSDASHAACHRFSPPVLHKLSGWQALVCHG